MLASPPPPRDGQSPTRRTLPFFVLALGITWLLQTPALLAHYRILPGPPERYLAPAMLGGFGPLIAALLVSRFEPGAAGVRALFCPPRPRRPGAAWYFVAFCLFPAIHLAGVLVYTMCGGHLAGPWLHLPETGQHVAAMLLIPIAEEPGWRGLALPRLQERHSPLAASLILGVAWALWHTVMFLLAGPGSSPGLFLLSMANILVGSVVFTWLYNRTQGSLLAAILAHLGLHVNNPFRALPADTTPFVIYTAAIGATAAALVIADRGAFRRPRGQA